jgi:tetratricopeptide (TPR) repeat protein
LGIVAQQQRQLEQAEAYFQKALQIKIDFNDRFEQASTLHNLGIVAQEQRQWEQAEAYYKNTLQIYIDFNDRFEQADTYGQLGLLAEAKEDWEAAADYGLQAAEIFAEYKSPNLRIALRALVRVRDSGQVSDIEAQLAKRLDMSVEEATDLLNDARDDNQSGEA